MAEERKQARSAPPALPEAVRLALPKITGKTIVRHAAELSDADMHGRAAGSRGARRAADYIAAEYRRVGLRRGGAAGSYFQTFMIRAGYQISSELRFRIDAKQLTLHREQDYMPIHLPMDKSDVKAELALVGYGISSTALRFDEYAGLDVTGKAVLVFAGVPWSTETAAWLWRVERTSHAGIAYKARVAAAHGAAMILVVDDPAGWRQRLGASEELRLPDRQFPSDSSIPVVHISRHGALALTGLTEAQLRQFANDIHTRRKSHSRQLSGIHLDYRAVISGQAVIGRNVIAVLPGSDPKRRREAIVIGAHFDHLGERASGTFFGANDNAAGVGALLNIADVCRSLPDPPARTLVFAAFGAEEIGKLGSNHYVAKPVIPISRTVAMINFDMIGQNDPNGINVCATRSSSPLHQLHQEANRHVGLTLTHPDNFRLGRSDHTAFFLAGVPVMYLFGGFHKEYNTPADTVDKLQPEKLERVARLAFLTAYLAAVRRDGFDFDWTGELPLEQK